MKPIVPIFTKENVPTLYTLLKGYKNLKTSNCIMYKIFTLKTCNDCPFCGKDNYHIFCLISEHPHASWYHEEDIPNALKFLVKHFPGLILEAEEKGEE